jgi:hypothetical protein
MLALGYAGELPDEQGRSDFNDTHILQAASVPEVHWSRQVFPDFCSWNYESGAGR